MTNSRWLMPVMGMIAFAVVMGFPGVPVLAQKVALVAEKAAAGPSVTAEVGGYALRQVQVVVPAGAPALTRRAARELCRYIYLLAGQWSPVVSNTAGAGRIIIRTGADARVPGDGPDPSQNFALYVENGNQVVHGASPVSTLWAAYELIESWGVGFYLGDDHLPKTEPQRRVALVERSRRPALAIRGNLPWCNFANSPTSWNPQDYRTFLEQMAKQKANFIGFHSYNWEPFAAYFPDEQTHVAGTTLMTATNPNQRHWSPPPWGAWNSLFGTDRFFDRDDWGSEVGVGETTETKAVRAQQQMMIDALAYAHDELGMKTCMGFEVAGDSSDPKLAAGFVVRLTHVLNAYPLDYLWVWQPEAASVKAKNKKPENELPEEIRRNFDYLDRNAHTLGEAQRMLGWIRLAYKTVQERKPQVKLVVSGWGGEQSLKFSDYYVGLDKLLPSDVIFSALDHIDPLHLDMQPEWSKQGYTHSNNKANSTYPARPGNFISGAYGQLSPGRQRWPILWFESDGYRNGDQTMPQPNIRAFEPALKDVVAKGCQGVLGIHWRTRNVREAAGYTYRFAWDPALTGRQFFEHFAADVYGRDLAPELAATLIKLDEFGSAWAGHSGTRESKSQFRWFQPWFGVPDSGRLGQLRDMRALLLDKSKAAARERPSAATELRDLADTIQWVVLSTETGMLITEASGHIKVGPLLHRLNDAEALARNGQADKAKAEALAIGQELARADFQNALPALARTVRTRGELGMLLTANQRYGRYYSEIADRLRKLAGQDVLPCKSAWTFGDVHNIFPVPSQIKKGQTVTFDAVLLPAALPRKCVVELVPLESVGVETVILPLKLMGGASYRAAFTPPRAGAFAWQIKPEDGCRSDELSWPSGVLTVWE